MFKKLDFGQFTATVKTLLGLPAFQKDAEGHETLTAEQVATLKQFGFDERWIAGFKAHLESPEDEKPSADASKKQMAVMAATMGSLTSQLAEKSEELAQLQQEALERETELTALRKTNAEVEALKKKINILSALPEQDPAQGAGAAVPSDGWNLDDDKQLGGMKGEMFSLDRAYNKRARGQVCLFWLPPAAKDGSSSSDNGQEENSCIIFLMQKYDPQRSSSIDCLEHTQPIVEEIKRKLKEEGIRACRRLGSEISALDTMPETDFYGTLAGWSIGFKIKTDNLWPTD